MTITGGQKQTHPQTPDFLHGNPDGQLCRELVREEVATAWFAITPESIRAARERSEKARQAKIVLYPAMEAA